jgi:Flp pilus assembly protein TadB
MSDEKKSGIGEQARALREDLSPSKIDEKLGEAIEERPKAKHLLDFSIVGKAVLAAVVVALILWLLFSPQLAAIALVLVFLGVWLGMAQLSYDKRRETRDARSAEPDSSGYEGDRGEVEAEKEPAAG